MDVMEASIEDMARMLGGPELMAIHHGLDPSALEVEIVIVDEQLMLRTVAAELSDPWFVDEDGVVVTTTDDVIQLDRSARFHSVYLAVALVLVTCGGLLTI